MSHMHDFALLYVEGHAPEVGPVSQSFQCSLKASPVLIIPDALGYLGVISKFENNFRLCTAHVQVIDKYQKEEGPQHTTLRDSKQDCRPKGHLSIEDNSLLPPSQPGTDPVENRSSYSMSPYLFE